jgi:hypothetical protein
VKACPTQAISRRKGGCHEKNREAG